MRRKKSAAQDLFLSKIPALQAENLAIDTMVYGIFFFIIKYIPLLLGFSTQKHFLCFVRLLVSLAPSCSLIVCLQKKKKLRVEGELTILLCGYNGHRISISFNIIA